MSRRSIQYDFEHRQQIGFTDFFNATDDLKLGDFIDGINMIDDFHSIMVALMHCVDPNVTRLSIGMRSSTFAYIGFFWVYFFSKYVLALQ